MDAAREVDIILNFLAETKEARAINKEIQGIIKNSKSAGQEAGKMGDYYSSEYSRWRYEQKMLSAEARAMQREMKYGWMASSTAYRKAREEMIFARYGMYRLAKAGADYNGTTRQMMQSVYALGAAEKKTKDDMIKANVMLRQSFIQVAGQMANLTPQAQRISENYERMRNPLYMINMGHLALAGALNRVANQGNAANLALRMLGPSANTKQLNDMVMMINQGLMRMQFVAIGAAITALGLYYVMHQLSKENEAYASALSRMGQALLKAFEPMIEIYRELAIGLFNFITRMARLVSEFNEANPTLAKFIQGMLLIIPLLTLILSPLAIGIGLAGGFRAALFAIWTLIGPWVTGIAAMSATVWLLAAALIGVYLYFFSASQAGENFRNMIDGLIASLGEKLAPVLEIIMPYLKQFAEYAINAFNTLREAISGAGNGDYSGLLGIFGNLLPTIVGLMVGGIPGLIISGARFLPAIAQGIQSSVGSIENVINLVVGYINSFFTNQFPQILQIGMNILLKIIEGITNALPILFQSVINIVNALVTTLVPLLPIIMDAGIQILLALINGIVSVLPTLIQAILNVITTLIQTIISMLPMILEMGVKVLIAFITGLVNALPQLLGAAISIILQLIAQIIMMLPQILIAGDQIIRTLAIGIVQAIGHVLIAVARLIGDMVIKFLDYDWASIGMNILEGIKNGIIGGAKAVLSAVGNVASSIAEKFTGFFGIHSPSRLFTDYGEFLMKGLDNGVVAQLPNVVRTTGEAGSAVMSGFDDGVTASNYATNNNRSINNAPSVTININGQEASGSNVDSIKETVKTALNEFMDYYATIYEG